MSTAVTTMDNMVYSYEPMFNEVNAYKLNFKKEANFALQLLKANNFLRDTAVKNPDSLKSAITNIASIGLSLNPASKEVYLVPRGGSIYADVSYIGLSNLATKDGHLLWVQAEIVKKNDKFQYLGVGKAPLHEMDPFGDRGEIMGVYCVAKTTTGEYLCTTMSKSECDQIREKCSKGSTSWKEFPEEMMKKTAIKRASKLWPKSERLDNAIDVINLHEGIDFKQTGSTFTPEAREEAKGEDAGEKIRELLATYGKSEDGLIKYINTQFKTEIKTIEEMTPEMIESSFRVLGA